MKKLVDTKEYRNALELFDRESKAADDIVLNLALKACTKLNDHRRGLKIHRQLSAKSLNNPFLQTSLIHFYMQCGDMKTATRLFNSIDNKVSSVYGAMFKGLLARKMPEKVLDIYERICLDLDEATSTMVLSACAQVSDQRARRMGRKLVENMPDHLRNSHNVTNSIIFMLMNFNDVHAAEELFQRCTNKSVSTYGALMKGYNQNQMFEKVFDLFETMPFDATEAIYTIVASACAQASNERAERIGRKLLKTMPDHLRESSNINNAIIFMLMKFGSVHDAEDLFRKCRNKTLYAYGSMMKGYNHNKIYEKVLDLFDKMSLVPDAAIHTIVFNTCTHLVNDRALRIGTSLLRNMDKRFFKNDIVVTSAIHMLMKHGYVHDAERLFHESNTKNVLAYYAMINGFSKNNELQKSIQLFEEMKVQGVTPNEMIFVAMIGVCAQIGIHSVCESVVDQIPSNLKDRRIVQNSLLSMWGKSGFVQNSQEIFQSMNNPDVFGYNSMINAYGWNGMGLEAVDLYRQMPDHLRDEVDGLSRLFMFDEAQEIIADYEKSHPPCSVMYTALLSGARNHRDSRLSDYIYERMKVLFPDQTDTLISSSVLLSNIYSSLGDHYRAEEIRSNRIKQIGPNLKYGVSWTTINGQLIQFKAHDRTHPQSNEIYAELNVLSEELIAHGHTYDSSWITRPLRDDESVETVLCGHSEKLAIVANLIQRPSPSIIQVTKNLRICGDCHAVSKLITKIRHCQIIIRDANRIHHFANGQCSCQDHF